MVKLEGISLSCNFKVVPKAGLEPARPLRRGILNPLRLPFRHLGPISFVYEGVKNPRIAKQARQVSF